MLQSLQFINGETIMKRVNAANGRLAGLLKQKLNDEPLIEQIYLWTLCRRLGDKERAKYLAIGESDRMTLRFVKPGK